MENHRRAGDNRGEIALQLALIHLRADGLLQRNDAAEFDQQPSASLVIGVGHRKPAQPAAAEASLPPEAAARRLDRLFGGEGYRLGARRHAHLASLGGLDAARQAHGILATWKAEPPQAGQ